MKRTLLVALFSIMAFVAVAAAQEAKQETKKEEAKPTTLTGEVVDLSCYMDHGAKGMDHAKCAMSCIKKGMPVGFLTSDGIMYVVLGSNHEPANAQVADFAGKKATITGAVKEDKGMKAIMLATIAESK